MRITRTAWMLVVPALLVPACGSDAPVRSTGSVASSQGPTAGTEPQASAGRVQIVAPEAGARIDGNVVTLKLAVAGLSVVKADGDTSGRTGHVHVFVDRDPVPTGQPIPKEPGIIHTADTTVTIPGLSVGRHVFRVVLGDGVHTRLAGDGAPSVEVDVAGPSVSVRAPAKVAAGSVVALDIAVEGLDIVAADGDTSGRTGHLHVFVDRDPAAPGGAIPKEAGIIHTTETHVEVPDLAPGDHVFWVVAGDGTHTALTPAVRATATVTVG